MFFLVIVLTAVFAMETNPYLPFETMSAVRQDELVYQLLIQSNLSSTYGGTYIDLAAGDPCAKGSNTFVLEKIFNWHGLLIDINADFKILASNCRDLKLSPYIVGNAITVNWTELIQMYGYSLNMSMNNVNGADNLPVIIDYLSYDLDTVGMIRC